MIGLSGEIPLVSHSDVTSPFPPSGNGGYASNRDVPLYVPTCSRMTIKLNLNLSLSCWNTALRPGIMLCFSMSQYMLPFMVPSMNCRSQVPAALIQPQTMTLSPPCLIVGKTHLSLYSSSGCRHTHLTPSEPNMFILVSSDHRTWLSYVLSYVCYSIISLISVLQCYYFPLISSNLLWLLSSNLTFYALFPLTLN